MFARAIWRQREIARGVGDAAPYVMSCGCCVGEKCLYAGTCGNGKLHEVCNNKTYNETKGGNMQN